MRYHYEPDEPKIKAPLHGVINPDFLLFRHQFLHACTLYKNGDKGLGVVKQYHDINPEGYTVDLKYAIEYPVQVVKTMWAPIDDMGLIEDIYRNNNFPIIFEKWAKEQDENGLYPITTVRKLMWALRMKPLPKERWETTFDRRFI